MALKGWVRVRSISELKVGDRVRELITPKVGHYVGKVYKIEGRRAGTVVWYHIKLIGGFPAPQAGETYVTKNEVSLGEVSVWR